MGLRAKILSLFLLCFVLMAVVGTLLLQRDVQSGFAQIERNEAQKLTTQFRTNLTAELEHLNELNTDWANWDGMYHFATNFDAHFAEDEIGPGALTSAGIAFVEILDTERERRFFRGTQAAVGLQASADGSPFDEAITEVQRFLEQPEAQKSCGLHRSTLGPVLMCWQPIHLTDRAGRSPGTLITGRFLDDALLDRIRKQSGIQFVVGNVPEEAAHAATATAFHSAIVLEPAPGTGDRHVSSGRVLDFAGHPAFTYQIIVPEDVQRIGEEITAKLVWVLLTIVVLTGLALLAGLHYLLVRPLQGLTGQLTDILAGGSAWPEQIRISRGSDEISRLGASINRLLGVIHLQIGTLERQSQADPLTRIANRRAFDQRLTAEMDRRANEGMPLSLLVVDVDYFRQYNDRHGQTHGDKVLQVIAEELKAVAGRPTDLVARLDGAEFAVLLSETDLAQAQKIAEDLRTRLAARAMPHQNSPIAKVVTVSVGVTTAAAERPVVFVARGGRAAQDAKQAGGNRICVLGTPATARA